MTPLEVLPVDQAQEAETAVGDSSLLPDPKGVLIIFWRRLWVFLALFLVIVGVAVAYANLAPRMYSSTAKIMIEPRKGDPVPLNGVAQGDQAPSSDAIDTQILVVDSPQLAAKVVTALDLTEDSEFGEGQPDADLTEGQRRARLIRTAQRLRGAVSIRRAGMTTLIEVMATTRSPVQSARIANEYVRQYLASLSNNEASADADLNKRIDGRLATLQADAEHADADLQNYKIAHGLMSSEGATAAEQEQASLNQQVQQARASLAEAQGRLDSAREQLRAGGGGSDVASALSSGTIGGLRQQEADSSRNLAQLRERYGPKHPAVAQEEQKLADVQRQIQLEINRILSSLEAQVHISQSGLDSLLASENGAKQKLAANASAQVGYLELQRKSEAARTIYEAFLTKSRGSAARDGIEQPLATMSSAALPSTTPTSPNVKLIYIVGVLGGLIAGLGGIVLAEVLDSGIRTKADVEKRLGARYLGTLPDVVSTLDGLRITEPPEDYVVSHPLSSFAEAMRALRASVTLRGRRRPSVLAVVSALPREGKTTTAMCLARTLAMSGASTVIVDCDLRRHSASDVLLAGRPGALIDVLSGRATIESALVADGPTDLQILGTDRAPEDGRDLLTPDLIQALIEQLRQRFEYVVIDTAPILGIADARAVAAAADAVVLLAKWRKTSMRAVDTALDLLIGVRAKVYGVALTLVDIRKFGSAGGEDIYGYHKKFKGYYVN